MVPFVKRLPTASGESLDVVVHELESWGASVSAGANWFTLVQEPFIAKDRQRADWNWDWRIKIPLFTFGAGLTRRPRIYQLCSAEDLFPLAMVSVLETERWIWNHRQSALFLWYLTGAPAAAVASRRSPKLVTAAAFDLALTVSLNSRANGRLWLHAAPEGGTRLLDWYEAKGLERVPLGTRLPGPKFSERINDGRYFYVTADNAGVVSDSMKEYRS